MDRMKLIAGLVVLCLVSSVAAFLLPMVCCSPM